MFRRILLIVGIMLALSPALLAQEGQASSDLQFGMELYKNKMYDLAEEQFSKFLQQYPASPSASQARYYLAMSQLEEKKFSSAATNFQAFAVQYPNDPLAPTAWINAGEAFAKADQYSNAGLAYERLRVFYPQDAHAPGALLKAARYFELSGDTTRAENSLLIVVNDYSSTSSYFQATLQLGNLYFGSGQLLKAENQYKSLLTSGSDSVRVMGLLALGKLNKMRGMTRQAEGYLDDAAQLNIAPQSLDALLESIEIDLEAGDFSRALQRAGQIDTSSLTGGQVERLEYERAYSQIGLGNTAGYENRLDRLRKLPAGYRIRLAGLLGTRAMYTDGVSLLRNLPSDYLTDETLTLYAELAFNAGRMNLADSLLSLSMERSKSPKARVVVQLLNIESVYLKNPELVRRTFSRYQGDLKDRPDAFLYYEAQYEANNGNYRDALRDLNEILEKYPWSDYAAASDSLSNYMSNFKDVDYKAAIVTLADIIYSQSSTSGNKVDALMHLGNLFRSELKDYGRAAEIYREVASIAAGDTGRIAEFLLAETLEKTSGAEIGENSPSYSIYQKLASGLSNDSISERSLYQVVRLQDDSGDSVSAESSALGFLKRFPNSTYVPEVYYILARTLYNSGAYHEAIAQAALAGAMPGAQLIMARAEIGLDSLSDAQSTLQGLFSSQPPEKYLIEGQLLYARLLAEMNLDAGQAYFQLLGEIGPSRYKNDIAAKFADYLYTTGRFDSAYSVYASIGADQLWHTSDPAIVYRMAYCKLKAGNLKRAEDLFQEVATNSGDSSRVADSYYQLGKIYASLGDKRMSASFYEKAGSGDLKGLLDAAETYFRSLDYADAKRVYQQILNAASVDTLKAYSAARLIDINYLTNNVKDADLAAANFRKNYPDAGDRYVARFLVDKAEYLIRMKSYAEARRILDKVKGDYDNTPSYPAALLDEAKILVEVGDLAKAQQKLEELIKKYPVSPVAPEAHLQLGNIFYAHQKYQDAIDNFRAIYLDSLADRSLMRDAMSRLINSYESVGMYDGALEVDRKFIAMFPEDPSIMDKKIQVGILYEEMNYLDQALLTFQDLVKQVSRDHQAELHYYIGAIYDDKGDYANAILEFLKVPYLVTPNPAVDWAAQAYYMAGKCYEKLNKPNEAIAMYEKIVHKPNTDATFIAGAEREINRVKALLK
ncbi:MAG: tetratricopeptide repeat protein [Bacteroidetes bacterium]|nr:tetratricopeptide repeat protein [Bacteroidota bacterium]MCL5034144.1 tetratricopeptide repeat protein [Bacteroidota bacterium]